MLLGNLEMLEESAAGQASQQAVHAALRRAGDSLAAIAQEITWAADIAPAGAPTLRAIDVAEPLAKAVHRCTRTGLDVTLGPVPHTPVSADPDWIRRGAVELIRWIAGQCPETHILVEVVDRGETVSIDVREALDSPASGDSRRAPMPANPTGLGTVLVDAVARAHGGELHIVESDTPRSASLVIAREPL